VSTPGTVGRPQVHGVCYAPPVTREKLKALLEEYGRVAIYTYLVIWLTVLAGFIIAISAGLDVSTKTGGAGVLLSAWLATKLTQPLRIAGTLAATPLVAAALKKWRKQHAPPPAAPPVP
jgi:hypothetical protein